MVRILQADGSLSASFSHGGRHKNTRTGAFLRRFSRQKKKNHGQGQIDALGCIHSFRKGVKLVLTPFICVAVLYVILKEGF